MTKDIDYRAVELPENKPREEYSYTERRAELLEAIERHGNPSTLNKSALGRQYGVSHTSIGRDFDALAEYIEETIGDDAKLKTKAAYEHILAELYEADDWRAKKAAWDVVMGFNEWLGEIGEQDREPKRAEVDVESRRAELAYHVVRDSGTDLDGDGRRGDRDRVDDVLEEAEQLDVGFTATPVRNGDGEHSDE